MADSNEILKVRRLNVSILKYFFIYFSSVFPESMFGPPIQNSSILPQKASNFSTKFIINLRSAFLFPGPFFQYSIHKEDHCIC